MKNTDQINFENKRVVIRVDFNVPLDDNLNITDDTRMRAALPTINKILNGKGMVVLMLCLGRPKKNPDPKFSSKPIIAHLSELLGHPVFFAEDCIKAADQVAALKTGEVLVLESSQKEFVMAIADYCEYYIINDAFVAARHNHASMDLIADYFLVFSLIIKVLLEVFGLFPRMSPMVSCIVDLVNIFSLITRLFGRH